MRATKSDITIPIAAEDGPPGPLPAWVTPALLARTIKIWSKAYGRPVSVGEAMEILANVKRLGDVLLQTGETVES